ncbi:efflux RND transporter periplasmic adaptor subunit [Pseudorhodoferax sp.]|uniref:efflux RND transporter periplasmic adaptor subunit n=1 Tax=Pseudorhodoferax sp. TaxID=1993553 RepID=UPI002DD6AA38|nr:efflux RND transporter periplasmic adaptor subunit [Pseudorhodoferax sp.]
MKIPAFHRPSPALTPPPPRLALALVLGLALGLGGCKDAAAPAAGTPPPAPEVGVVTVATADAPLDLELPGRLAASQVAEIRPQVSGLVQGRLFTEGARVAAGQPLYQLDDAALRAEHSRAAAALQKAEAQRANSRIKAARDAELHRADVISREAADDSASAQRQAEADVAVAQASLEAARVQLERARILAPIAGRVDISTVSAGALVTANQAAALTTVQQIDPMHVDIVQSSVELLSLRRQLGSDGSGGPDGGSRRVQLVLEDGTLHPQAAQLQVSGVTVDRGTGAVTLRAVVPNPQGTLLPGMVVSARLRAGIDRGVILVPQQGVTRSPTGDATALVVGADGKAELRRLTLVRAVGNQWLVGSGLQAGERLIVEGLQRVRAGQKVTPVPAGSTPARAAGGRPASAAAPGSAAASTPAAAASR